MATNAERYLISSVLRNGDMKIAAAQGLNQDMFHSFSDEWAWMERFYMKHKKAPSKVAFHSRFPDFGIKAVDDTSHFAEEVKRAHSRFLLVSTMSQVADLIADGKVDEAVQIGYASMIQVAGAIGAADDPDIISTFDDVYEDAERRLLRTQGTGYSGIPTGFPTLDDRTGGPQPGDFWVVAARLGEGKSFTMQRMATTAVMKGYNVQYDALEQTRPQVAYRIHAFMSSSIGENIFRTTDLMRGKDFDPREYKRFLRGLKKKIKGSLHICDATRGKVGLMSLVSQMERNRPDIMFVDYLTLLDKPGSDWQDIAGLSGGLLGLATEYEVPVIAASQLNRERGLGKEPAGPEALSGSDAIGQDASLVLTIKQSSPHTMIMKVPKNRNGEGGFKWHNHFDPGNGVFEEVSYDRWLELKDLDADAAGV